MDAGGVERWAFRDRGICDVADFEKMMEEMRE